MTTEKELLGCGCTAMFAEAKHILLCCCYVATYGLGRIWGIARTPWFHPLPSQTLFQGTFPQTNLVIPWIWHVSCGNDSPWQCFFWFKPLKNDSESLWFLRNRKNWMILNGKALQSPWPRFSFGHRQMPQARRRVTQEKTPGDQASWEAAKWRSEMMGFYT